MRMPRCRRTSSSANSFAGGSIGPVVAERRRYSGEQHDSPRKSKMERRDQAASAATSQLNDDKLEALNQFRVRVSGCASEESLQDHFLLQWLTARCFNVDKAEAMFRKSQQWRAELDMDHILEWKAPEVLVKYSPLGYIGLDQYGGSAVIVPHGRGDTRGLLSSASKMDNIRYTVQSLERSKVLMAEESKRRGVAICQQTCVFDLEGFSFREFTWKPALEFVIDVMQVYEANYPELLRVAYVINAPKIFTMAYAMIKPFLHEVTINKIQIYGRSGWQQLLLQDIDAAVLPKHWGGDRVDDDGNEFCESVVCMGGEVPQSYYRKNRTKDPNKDYKTVTVGKGSSETIKIKVVEPKSILRWEFETDDYDIGFSVELEGSEQPTLLPLRRVNSHQDPEEGQVECPSPGIYDVTFDNSFSYMRSKKLHYCIQVSEPDGDLEQ